MDTWYYSMERIKISRRTAFCLEVYFKDAIIQAQVSVPGMQAKVNFPANGRANNESRTNPSSLNLAPKLHSAKGSFLVLEK